MNKRSILNATTSLMLTLFNGIMGFIFVKVVLSKFGSDFNGLTSTATQLSAILMIIEGGLTMAVNVAMFKPIQEKNIQEINKIYNTTMITFRRIGYFYLTIGIMLTFIYSFFINSSFSYLTIVFVFLSTIIPSGLNLAYGVKYKVLIQANKQEYIISFITLLTLTISYGLNIILMRRGTNIFVVRIITALSTASQSLLMFIYCKIKNIIPSRTTESDFTVIKDTKFLLVQKISDAIYRSFPLLTISITPEGTVFSSIYAVYNSVFMIIKSIIISFLDAPRLSLGELITENNQKKLDNFYFKYQMLSIFLSTVLISVTYLLIIPFISIFYKNVKDANYLNYSLAMILSILSLFEVLRVPFSNLINMAGKFKASMQIELSGLIVLLLLAKPLYLLYGVNGIMLNLLLSTIIKYIFELIFIYRTFIDRSSRYIILLLLNFILIGITTSLLKIYSLKVITLITFIKFGFLFTFILSFLSALLNLGLLFFFK